VEFDDVLNRHREVFYADRQKVLEQEDLREMILEWIEGELAALVSSHFASENPEEWDVEGLVNIVRTIFPLPPDFSVDSLAEMSAEEVSDHLFELAEQAYAQKEQALSSELMRRLEKTWVLMVMDRLWTHHLTAMDDLESGIGLQAYGQRDPLVMYKIEAHRMFEELMAALRREVVGTMFHVTFTTEPPRRQQQTFTNRDGDADERQPVRAGHKTGRNDPCPCGSGKKYKRCHGR
jgi:preprotein translocase subunit SecA